MSPPTPWTTKSVVIIDDSAAVREELKKVFQGCGMEVVGTAENGVMGIEVVRQTRPEIVSIDIIMPEMDGIECYKKIQAAFPSQKCVIVSWLAGEAKVLESLKEVIPGYAFQKKPVSIAEMGIRLGKIYFPETTEEKDDAKPSLSESVEDFRDLGIKVS